MSSVSVVLRGGVCVAVWRRCVAPLVFRAPGVLFCGAGLLGVPVGGGPPASRPRRELRSARRLEARLSHDTLIPGEQES